MAKTNSVNIKECKEDMKSKLGAKTFWSILAILCTVIGASYVLGAVAYSGQASNASNIKSNTTEINAIKAQNTRIEARRKDDRQEDKDWQKGVMEILDQVENSQQLIIQKILTHKHGPTSTPRRIQ
jgi:cell division protein FtsB